MLVSYDVLKDKGGLRITAAKFISVEDELDGVQHSLKLCPQGKGRESIPQQRRERHNQQRKSALHLTDNLSPEE